MSSMFQKDEEAEEAKEAEEEEGAHTQNEKMPCSSLTRGAAWKHQPVQWL